MINIHKRDMLNWTCQKERVLKHIMKLNDKQQTDYEQLSNFEIRINHILQNQGTRKIMRRLNKQTQVLVYSTLAIM